MDLITSVWSILSGGHQERSAVLASSGTGNEQWYTQIPVSTAVVWLPEVDINWIIDHNDLQGLLRVLDTIWECMQQGQSVHREIL